MTIFMGLAGDAYLSDIVQAAPNKVANGARTFSKLEDAYTRIGLAHFPKRVAICVDPDTISAFQRFAYGL